MKPLLLLAVALALTGCVTATPLTPEGSRVRMVGADLSSLQGCTPIRLLSVAGGSLPQGQENNVVELRNEAAAVGANALAYTETWAGPFAVSTASGTAYRCP